jgi:hypothetical protein
VSPATSTEAQDDIIKIRLTSFWTYRVDGNDVMEPEQVGALTRFWHGLFEQNGGRRRENLLNIIDLETLQYYSTNYAHSVWRLLNGGANSLSTFFAIDYIEPASSGLARLRRPSYSD